SVYPVSLAPNERSFARRACGVAAMHASGLRLAVNARPVAVVTGASAGVGRATAVEFAEHGFDVALLARGEAGLAAAARDVEVRGAVALPLCVDVAAFAEVDQAADAVEREL